MTTILSAKPVIAQKLADLAAKCTQLKSKKINPKLTVLMVGDSPASALYVRNKQKLCLEVGAEFESILLPSHVSKAQVEETIERVNKDSKIHGFIIQLPVMGEAQKINLDWAVAPHKDVDGFHPHNIFDVVTGKLDQHSLVPCTPQGVMTLLKAYNIDIKGKRAVVIGRSMIVGKPMSFLLTNANATVTLCHSGTPEIHHYTKEADLVVTAIGKPNIVDASYFTASKKTVVVDVGINRLPNNKFVGDVDFEQVAPIVGAITPVPGGVGPMTVFTLIENLLKAAERQGK